MIIFQVLKFNGENIMKIYRLGEKSKAICSKDGLTETTFTYRDVKLSDNSTTISHILVAVCDQCGEVVGIPSQSTMDIKDQLK